MFNEVEKKIIETNIICPECNVKGAESGFTTTCMAVDSFTDQDGHYHVHNLNHCDGLMTCPQGHRWSVRMINSCWCGWAQNNPRGAGSKSFQQNPDHGVLGIETSIVEKDSEVVVTNRILYKR